MSKETYYGTNENSSISYLEFGSVNIKEGKKEIWGYWQDQTAYDFYMFSRYARDLFAFRDFIGGEKKTIETLNQYIMGSAHDKLMDYLFKYAGILTCLNYSMEKDKIICESGSSLYGLIEEVLACDEVFYRGTNRAEIEKLKYLCSDISEMMNNGAKAFHSNISFEIFEDDTIYKLMQNISYLTLFYGLSVSLRYALRKAHDIIDIASKTELVIINRLSMAKDETIISTYGTGKSVYIISEPELTELLKRENYIAKYCTASMQFDRDGENTIRASLVISRNEKLVNEFIKQYNYLIDKSITVEGVYQGEWKDIDFLKKEFTIK